jgi:hypothetical protein
MKLLTACASLLFLYLNNCFCRFIKYIYESLFITSKHHLQENVHFFSILIDGATDSSVTENELIYLRFVEDGKPVNHYFSIENVEHADAAGIVQTIEQAFVKKGLENWKDKLIGFVQTEPLSILVLMVELLHLSKGNVRILLLSIVLLTDLSLLPIVLSSIT